MMGVVLYNYIMLRHESHVFELRVETKFEVVDSHSLFNPKSNSCALVLASKMLQSTNY